MCNVLVNRYNYFYECVVTCTLHKLTGTYPSLVLQHVGDAGMTALLVSLMRPQGAFAGLLLTSPLVCTKRTGSWGEWAQIMVSRQHNGLHALLGIQLLLCTWCISSWQ